MVFPDLSKHSQFENGSADLPQQIAPVGDRLLAFFFDICLFSPVFTLLLSPLFRKIEFHYYTDPGSMEFAVLVMLAIGGVAILTVFAQAFFIWKWGATPGKFFFKLKVISLSGKSLSFPQCVLRSALWILEFVVLTLPFFEILSQRQRRPLHDRASDTMVVTLKLQGDGGPHPLEANLIRNLILVFTSMAFLWGFFVIGQFYRMAVRGDFKRAELEEREMMCPSVTDKVERGQMRLDLATAQYVAGEIDEDCLMSEADFALWTSDKTQQAWGYFAKSVYFEFDTDKSNEYLNLVCQTDSSTEACRLAKALKSENREEILKPAENLVSLVFKIRELSNRGDFVGALHELTKLTTESSGFEKYSQKQTVKLLWALNRKEAASGAYMNSWKYMGGQDQVDLASWLCLEQVGDRCESRNYQPCNDLKENLQDNAFNNVTSEAVIGLVLEDECKKTHSLQLLSFHKILEENEPLRELTMALSSESDWSSERRMEVLRHLSFDENVGSGQLIQKRARLALMQRSKDPSDAVALLQVLRSSNRHDWVWHSLMQKISGLAGKAGYTTLAREIKKELPQLQKTTRLPASESSK